MDAPAPVPAPSDPAAREDQARSYEAIQNRLFLVRLVLSLLAVAVYLLSGASQELAAGLARRFDAWWAWPIVNGLHVLITVFGFSALMFPLSLYSDYVLEKQFGLSHQEWSGWLGDYLKALLLEMALALVFFETVYALLRWFPSLWWVLAAFCYTVFVVVLTALAPVLILPLFHKVEPLDNPELAEAVEAFARREGLQVLGVFRWCLEEKTAAGNAALAGLGKTRRILLADTLLEHYTRDEILAILAHEVGHYLHKDLWRLIAVGAVLAAFGFFLAHLFLLAALPYFGFQYPGDIGALPLFVFSLFIFSLAAMPLTNAYSRRLEYMADAFAVNRQGTAEPLVAALKKLADQNLADQDPPRWIEILLHSHPAVSRRVARARAIAARIGSKINLTC